MTNLVSIQNFTQNKQKWTEDAITELFGRCDSITEVIKISKSAYNAAKAKGIFDELIKNYQVVKGKHNIEIKYTKEKVLEKMLLSTSATDFHHKYQNYALASKKQGFYYELMDTINFTTTPKNYGGFRDYLPGRLYYLQDFDTKLYKIGITNKEVGDRFGWENMENGVFDVIKEWQFKNGKHARMLERHLHTILASKRCNNLSWKNKGLGGWTEFFSGDVLKDMLEYDEHFICKMNGWSTK